ncbi:helix-loop-helix protein lin-22-like [Anthonomus grandis grandis]|uniref:helix-loop-helix protein lin-22-like n=1 Tax=Anthonomus grandis grandis TaxID=2921223 RepID=UPI00216676D0|nr:helix-loop-helix protein lin-22-like [Anthonomus grandis grandis]
MKSELKKPVSETRKIRKPLMEKKRRARINDSLEVLKRILLESKSSLKDGGKNGQRTAKLEKADILEMTVQYLQSLHCKLNELQEVASGTKKEANNICASENNIRVALYPSRIPQGDYIVFLPTESKKDSIDSMNVWRPW